MKKVYILINHLQIQDGVARTAVSLANELAKREDVEVTLQSIFRFDKSIRNHLSPKIKVKTFFGFYFRGLARLVDLIPDRMLYRLLVRENYDIEIGYCMILPTRIVSAGTRPNCRRYAWMHGYDTGLTLLDSYRKMDQVITVSQENAMRFFEESGGIIPVCCCYNLVDDQKILTMGTESINQPDMDGVTFAAVGRLEHGKGILRLIECCGRLKQEGYRFQLWLVGDGEQRAELESRTTQLDLDEEVAFFGMQSNPYAYISKADVLVCPSYSEGYSTVCAEAILLNVPVLTTSVGGAREIIEDACCGRMVGMADSELYEGLKDILDHPEQIALWKQILTTTKSKFSYEKRAKRIAEVLDI